MPIKDTTPPKVIFVSPQKNSKSVAPDRNIVLMFNEKIKAGQGNIVISNGAGDEQIISMQDTNGYSIEATVLTINLIRDLLTNSHYSVRIDPSAIKDISDNSYAGIKTSNVLFFDTIDTLPPAILKSNPLANAKSVVPKQDFELTFNEPIRAGVGNVTLTNDIYNLVIPIADKQIKISGNKLTINPSFDLNTNTSYRLHIDAGAILDVSANGISAFSQNFTTQKVTDKQAPVLQNFFDKGGITDNIHLIFQESIKIGKGSFTLSDGKNIFTIPVNSPQVSVSGNSLIINPDQNFELGKSYTLTAPQGFITDSAGNQVAKLSIKSPFIFNTVTTSTADTTAPTASLTAATLTSADNATVKSSEKGTAYLVSSKIPVTHLADITSAADALWNAVAISQENTNTALPLTGLSTGTYHLYSVDGAGNLSVMSNDYITIGSAFSISSASNAKTINATKNADTFNISTGEYHCTINGFATGDVLSFFPNVSLNFIPDIDQKDGIQEIDAIDLVNSTTTVIFLSDLTNEQDGNIYNLPSFLKFFPQGIIY